MRSFVASLLRMTEREAMLGRDDKSEAARPQDDRKRASLGRDDREGLFCRRLKFYILHFTFIIQKEILRLASLAQDDKGEAPSSVMRTA